MESLSRDREKWWVRQQGAQVPEQTGRRGCRGGGGAGCVSEVGLGRHVSRQGPQVGWAVSWPLPAVQRGLLRAGTNWVVQEVV
jgi:hypothetical protein